MISIDGIHLQAYTLATFRKHVGLVPQDVFLFSGSIYENVTLGNPDIASDRVVEAMQRIGMHEFVLQLPGSYDYNIRERGMTLSMGQRQLLVFARVLIYDPSILILDEATSSLDSESEKHVQIALDQVMEGRTSLVIAHRLSTIRNADKIVVLEKGLIRESGKHEELMAREDGLYQKLSQLQLEQA